MKRILGSNLKHAVSEPFKNNKIQQESKRSFAKSQVLKQVNPITNNASDPDLPPRDVMNYDVVIVGGGPAGLSAAIKVKQMAKAQGKELSVCLLEKGQQVSSHILSGACIETRSLKELFPGGEWDPEVNKEEAAPLRTKVTTDRFRFLTEKSSYPLPIISINNNHGNYIISLGELCGWLGKKAEEEGVEVFAGFPASEVLYDEKNRVKGVATKDVGIGKDGKIKDGFQRGIEIHAQQTILAEGCRGSLTRQLVKHYNLRKDTLAAPTYGLGIKEVWEVDPSVHSRGAVTHTVGWPMDYNTYGGSWMYHYDENKVSIGFVTALDYKNPTLSPYQEFQRLKHHPLFREIFAHPNSQCIQYGARTVYEGGLQAQPKLTFPGGILIGDTAGFLNVPKIKGVHAAMKSGMLGAEAVYESLDQSKEEAVSYTERFKSSWLYDELYAIRNVRPYFNYGLLPGLVLSGADMIFFNGKLPFTLKHHADNEATKPVAEVKKIQYPKPDGKISFDLLTNLTRSGTNHNHDQPAHLKPQDKSIPVNVNLKIFGGPEQYYCPAKVYEYVEDASGSPYLQINAQNCLHCKACDIKDPKQNIVWTTPEGGGGPSYLTM